MAVSNKAEFELNATKLYELETQKRAIESEQDRIKDQLLSYMNDVNHIIQLYSTDSFIIEKSAYIRYGVPTPDRLRGILGKDAENYIEEVVKPEVRLVLPPALAAKECPVVKNTEYVRLKIGPK